MQKFINKLNGFNLHLHLIKSASLSLQPGWVFSNAALWPQCLFLRLLKVSLHTDAWMNWYTYAFFRLYPLVGGVFLVFRRDEDCCGNCLFSKWSFLKTWCFWVWRLREMDARLLQNGFFGETRTVVEIVCFQSETFWKLGAFEHGVSLTSFSN